MSTLIEAAKAELQSLDAADRRAKAIKALIRAYTPPMAPLTVRKYTHDREMWLRHNYPTTMDSPETILGTLNTMPGEPLTRSNLSGWAFKLRLTRCGEYLHMLGSQRGSATTATYAARRAQKTESIAA